MKSFKILKINNDGLNYVLNERTGYYDVEENQDLEDDNLRSVGLLDMIILNGIEIITIKRNQDNEIFSLNDTIVLNGNNTTKYNITFFDIVLNKLVIICENNREVYEFELDNIKHSKKVVNNPNNTLKGIVDTITANNPRAIRLERLLKTRPANETLKDFLIKFFSGKGDMENGWNYSRNTIYVDDNSVQTEHGKRRSLGDIFMICRYYYPNCTIKEVLKLLYVDLPNHYESGFRSVKCRQINKRVWYYSLESVNTYLQENEDDEYGINKASYLELVR